MEQHLTLRIVLSLLLGLVAAASSRILRFLTPGGALAAGLLAILLFGLGGLQWLVPILLFFLSSSLLSRLRERVRPSTLDAFSKGSERDEAQVLANGGAGALLVVLWHWQPGSALYAAYLGSLAAATADTWGTELGMLSGERPFLVTTWKRVEVGESGAISAAGCAGGAAGAFSVALCGSLWAGPDALRMILVVGAAGIFGSVADSFTGALWQVHYLCEACGAVTERSLHCGREARYDHGARWLTNDRVNLICTVVGAIVAYLLWLVPL